MKIALIATLGVAAVAGAAMLGFRSDVSANAAGPSAVESGLNVGEMVTPFHPTHVSGPHKGTDACPPCTYGNKPQVQVWVNEDSDANVMAISQALSTQVTSSKTDLKAFVIKVATCAMCEGKTNEWGAAAEAKGLGNISIAHIAKADSALTNYKINAGADVKNTILLYKDRKIAAKFVNLDATTPEGLKKLNMAVAAL